MNFNKLGSLATFFLFSFNLHAQILSPLADNQTQNLLEVSDSQLSNFSHRNRTMLYDSNSLFKPSKVNQTAKSAKQTSSSIQQSITLTLFDDMEVSAQANQTYTRPDGSIVWLGRVIGETNSSVNLIASENTLTGNIRSQGRLFQIRTLHSGSLFINEFNAPSQPETDVVTANSPKISTKSKTANSSSTYSTSAYSTVNSELPIYSNSLEGFTDSADVKVLVYYSHQALEDVPDLLNVIDLEFIDTNQAFANSGIEATVSIAAKIAVDESPISGGASFDEMVNRRGAFTYVDEVRLKYHADLVHFYPTFISNPNSFQGYCGLANYAADTDGSVSPSSSFGTTAAWCAGNLTTAHELGHNLGAKHDRYVEDGGDDDPNYGYVDLTNQFQTIMSYPDECDDNGINCTEITHFSNPEKTYNEFPTGIDSPVSQATNNAKQINDSALSLANFLGVTAPTITSMTQGENLAAITIQWSTVSNATSYLVNRREANLHSNLEPLCSYPVYGEEFEVTTNEFIDNSAQPDTVYCYSITPQNDRLLDGLDIPESFVRTGYVSDSDTLELPFIDDLHLGPFEQNYSHNLNLPSGFDYQIYVVEHSLDTSPNVQLLTDGSEGGYQLEITNIAEENQTVILALEASHTESGKQVAQLFNFFVNTVENQVPEISIQAEAELNQQSTTQVLINLTDDQAIAEDGVYAYSLNEDLLPDVSVSVNEQGQYALNLTHEGLNIGETDVIVGYSDSEYLSEATISVKVVRSIFTPTRIQQDVTWYVKPGESITRLLPFYDNDEGEILTVNIVNEPSQGALAFELSDKVTYTANSDFSGDSFSFYVTGEDGISTENVTVNIEISEERVIAPKQKVVVAGENAAFLSHQGHLYTWGRNDSGETGTQIDADDLYTPTKVEQEDWVDIGLRHSEAFTIKQDGTLWHAGYDFVTRERHTSFTQFGTDSDWQSIIGVDSSRQVLLTKTDGSIWARGFNKSNFLTNRGELKGEIRELTQILSLYNVKEIQYTERTGFALTEDNLFYSWNNISSLNLGRSIELGYLAPVENVAGKITSFSSSVFRSTFLLDGYIYAWGGSRSDIFFGAGSQFTTPTQISSEQWISIALNTSHIAAVRDDGTLWTAGGTTNSETGVISAQYLGRGENADFNIAQAGNKTNWLQTWVGLQETFALDEDGQVWVTGGDNWEFAAPLIGLGESISIVHELTAVDAIPNEITGTEDSDDDGLRDYLDSDDDNDGVLDQYDAFRTDATESLDTDLDGIGNNADTDDDGDGVTDGGDLFPLDSSESIDTDLDGIGNNADTDDDGDGVADDEDAFSLDSSETLDTDLDGIGNNADTDDDGDGVADDEDAFSLDSSETLDTDLDGIGNHADTDDDGDGVADDEDAFSLDSSETLDTDLDGIGNHADTDDDGDGFTDDEDIFPLDSTESIDTDLDGIGNNSDTDDDGDGVADDEDAFSLDSSETLDTDLDGIGNNADTDDDNDGVNDSSDAYPLDANRSALPSASTPTNNDSGGGGTLSYFLLMVLLVMRFRIGLKS